MGISKEKPILCLGAQFINQCVSDGFLVIIVMRADPELVEESDDERVQIQTMFGSFYIGCEYLTRVSFTILNGWRTVR
jgi:hypothetical protein